jgi:hypothetical protein
MPCGSVLRATPAMGIGAARQQPCGCAAARPPRPAARVVSVRTAASGGSRPASRTDKLRELLKSPAILQVRGRLQRVVARASTRMRTHMHACACVQHCALTCPAPFASGPLLPRRPQRAPHRESRCVRAACRGTQLLRHARMHPAACAGGCAGVFNTCDMRRPPLPHHRHCTHTTNKALTLPS